MNFSTASLSAAVVALAVAGPAAAGDVEVLDLSGFCHADIASGHNLNGVTIAADNWHNDLDLAVVFDTTARRTADRDLEGFNARGRGNWGGGNLAADCTNVGNVLIIQEQNRNTRIINKGRSVNIADDEGRRPAGELYFGFDDAITSFGFDLIDVEGTSEFRKGSGFFATFTGLTQTVSVAFKDLIDPCSKFYDSTVKFGNNSANRIQPITAAQLGLKSFQAVTVNLGGSGAVGNINYVKDCPPVAAPTPSAAVAGLALLGLVGARRRRKI